MQPQVFMELGRHLEKHEIIRPEWQRPYLQRSLETLFSPAQPQLITPEKAVKVLQIAAGQSKATALPVTVPDMPMDRLSWSFLAHFVANSFPDDAAEQRPAGQPLRLVYYDNKRPLMKLLTADEDFAITVTDNVTRIPGSPEVSAVRAARDAAQVTLNALAARSNPSATEAELAAARSQLAAVEQALAVAMAAPKWRQTVDLTLTVAVGAKVVAQTTLNYGRWQQVAVTLGYDYDKDVYALELWVDGQSRSKNEAVAARVFTEQSELTIGQDKEVPSRYTTQMSEFRLWSQVRSAAELAAEQDQRKTTSLAQGLFHIGLDRPEGRTNLNLRPSAPPLDLRRVSAPEPPAERERILLLWGKDIRKGIRNTLQTDENFNMTLEVQPGTPASYDLDLAEKRLYVLETPEFSINDYAAGQQLTLSRFRADVKNWIISAANRNYALNRGRVPAVSGHDRDLVGLRRGAGQRQRPRPNQGFPGDAGHSRGAAHHHRRCAHAVEGDLQLRRLLHRRQQPAWLVYPGYRRRAVSGQVHRPAAAQDRHGTPQGDSRRQHGGQSPAIHHALRARRGAGCPAGQPMERFPGGVHTLEHFRGA
ncbi:MAG: LamG-like jellyroll fold domain-containing protein [Anaerolineae bacterium]